MAFFGWVKRLLGRLLERPTAACTVCGKHIRPSDLSEGAAVIIAKHPYCPNCVAKIIREKKGRSATPAEHLSSHTTTVHV